MKNEKARRTRILMDFLVFRDFPCIPCLKESVGGVLKTIPQSLIPQ